MWGAAQKQSALVRLVADDVVGVVGWLLPHVHVLLLLVLRFAGLRKEARESRRRRQGEGRTLHAEMVKENDLVLRHVFIDVAFGCSG
jgi:hypothetical protein